MTSLALPTHRVKGFLTAHSPRQRTYGTKRPRYTWRICARLANPPTFFKRNKRPKKRNPGRVIYSPDRELQGRFRGVRASRYHAVECKSS